MKKIYFLTTIFSMLLMIGNTSAQRIVNIPASADPSNPTDIFPVIMGDTTANGDRVDNNTIYKLENGEVYVTTGRIVNKPTWPLQIEAADLTDLENKAILSRIPNTSGDYQDVMWPEGDVTLHNLWIVSGQTGALEQHDWGKIRLLGAGSRVIVTDCIIEKDRGGFLQVRAGGIKLYVDNCIFRNGGNRRILQGNGRGIDCREFAMDTVVMTNTIVHNIQDRFFRSQGALAPHKYIEIDHCTSFNTIGRHGHIQLGRVENAKITNNLFVNPIMLGSSPIYTDEQSQPDGDKHKVITIDTLYSNTALSISNNNIFWTDDVTNYWASNDTVNAPDVLSDLVIQSLGGAASDAFFQEQLTLNDVPGSILQYVEDLYANPAAVDMYDFIVEDVELAGTPFDSGNLFDFDNFDPCYAETSMSATAAMDGGGVGVRTFCPQLVNGTVEHTVNNALALQVYPNPAVGMASFQFQLEQSSETAISVRSLSGQLLAQPLQADLAAGQHTIDWDFQLPQGMYLVTLQTEMGIMTQKLMVQ